MTRVSGDKPILSIEVVELAAPEMNSDTPSGLQRASEDAVLPAPLIGVETLDTAELACPEPEPLQPQSEKRRSSNLAPRRGTWFLWSALLGVAGLALVSTLDWTLGLLARTPALGIPAAFAVGATIAGLLGVVIREFWALRCLRDAEEVRAAWKGADGSALRNLILRVGTHLGSTAIARAAADMVDDAGPVAARKFVSRNILASRDRHAAEAVARASRQGFAMTIASPSPALDGMLLIIRATCLLRQIATIYDHRPGALALRALALAAGRDAGAVAIAEALAQVAAHSAGEAMVKTGDKLTQGGFSIGGGEGLAVAGAGLAISLVGRGVGAEGGAIGGATVAAWRLYRFGMTVLVASRPLPFDDGELTGLKARMRAEMLSLKLG